MSILLVPPIDAAGSNVVFLSLLLFCFLFLTLILCDFHFIYFSSFFRLRRLIEGVVWRGRMTSLLCLFRIVWRQGAGHSWRTQDGDGSLGSKVPGGLAERTWPCYSYHKLLPLPGGCFVLRSACYFPLVRCLTRFTGSDVFLLFSFFFSSSFLSSVCHISCGGGARQFVSLFFCSFDLSFFSFLFSLVFPFVSLFHRMCMPCLSYPVQWHGIALPIVFTACLVRGNVDISATVA